MADEYNTVHHLPQFKEAQDRWRRVTSCEHHLVNKSDISEFKKYTDVFLISRF
jgi:hypothetical protein